MVVEKQKELPEEDKIKLLNFLNEYGKKNWILKWNEHIALPDKLFKSGNRELVIRYLLFRALINQQANVEKARELPVQLYEAFGDEILVKPWNIDFIEVLGVFKMVGGPTGSKVYKVGFLGGIKPTSLFTYRFTAYMQFIRKLEKANLQLENIITSVSSVRELYDKLKDDEILNIGWVGNDPKACRMFVDWVTYFYTQIWKIKTNLSLRNTLMLIDGHSGKVFARTGFISKVYYEKRRPYIIEASKMRKNIEDEVIKYQEILDIIPFYVDNGAFYLYLNGYCLEESPQCIKCPIRNLCMRYTKWTGYEKQK